MARVGRARGAAVIVVVAATAALTAFGVFGARGAAPHTGPLVVRTGLERPPGPFVRGEALYDGKGGRTRLGGSVSGALMGPLSPVAVASPDGESVLYNTWRELRRVDTARSFSKQGIGAGDALGTPSLRLRAAEHDVVFERGAYSAAWRRDGAIAFVRGVDPNFRAGLVYTGQVVVRRGLHGREAPWTTEPARYVVYAWAGDRLLFYRLGEGETLHLLVADGPGQVRPLTDGSAIALSPDGSRVAVLSPDAKSIRVLGVADGGEHGLVDLTTSTPSLAWAGYSGSWVGEHIVAPASSGLAVFLAHSDSIELEQVLSLDETQFPAGVQEPRFTDEVGNEIVASADVPPKEGHAAVSFFLSCDRIARSCERGEETPARDWQRLVDNPSRPEEGGK